VYHTQLGVLGSDILHKLKQANTQDVQKRIDEVTMTDFQLITLESPPDHYEISTKISALCDSIMKLMDSIKLIRRYHTTLKKVRFRQIDSRYKRIQQAHDSTLNWVYADAIHGLYGPIKLHFRIWLEQGDGIFWVRGNAGCGKSTLMKFLCDDAKTSQYLGTPSLNVVQRKFVIAKHFFWNPGSPLQKSQDGLLRSLVYDVLRSCPDAMAYVEDELQKPNNRTKDADTDLWTQTLLWEILNHVLANILQAQVCFFIDGLDEYAGDSADLKDTLRRLVTHPNVKICASSRPWEVFMSEFGCDETRILRLEDFNAQDIRDYVDKTLFTDSVYRALADNEAESVNEFKEKLVVKSDGAFLWVNLVVRSLLEDAESSDAIHILQERLDLFPADLDGCFKQILKAIPENDHPNTAATLKVIRSTTSALPAMVYYFVGCVKKEASFAFDCDIRPMSEGEAEPIIRDMEIAIDRWTKGLLEVVHGNPEELGYEMSHVDFLHRTVRDYIVESDEVDKIFEKSIDPKLDMSALLCHGLLAFMKKHPRRAELELMKKIGFEMFYQASFVQDVLWRMWNIHPALHEAGSVFYGPGWQTRPANAIDMCKYAAEYGLDDYIENILVQAPERHNITRQTYSMLLEMLFNPVRKPLEHKISMNNQLVTARYLIAMGARFELGVWPGRKALESIQFEIGKSDVAFELFRLLISAWARPGPPLELEIRRILPKEKAAVLFEQRREG
jgi:hypothetical protein